MKHRPVALVLVIGFITFGIYDLFWLYNTRQELAAKGLKVLKLKTLFFPLLALIFIALLQFVVHFVLNSGGSSGSGTNVVNALSLLVGVLALITLIPLSLYWFYVYCKAVNTLTNGKVSVGGNYTAFLILHVLGLGFIWYAIVQSQFNKFDALPAAR